MTMQLVFAGELLAGESRAEVRRRLGELLKLDDARLDTLFCGRQVVIKRGLDDATAGQ